MAPEPSTLDLPDAPATSPTATGAPGATPEASDPLDALASPALTSADLPDAPAEDDPDAAPEGAVVADAEPEAEGVEEVPPVDGQPDVPAVEFDIAVPLPSAEGKRSGTLEFSFPTQEARDTVQFHVKRSLELDAAKADAEAGLTAKATLDHLERSPETAMYQLEAFKPEAATAYVKNWASRNPIEAAKLVLDLGFIVQDPWNDGSGTNSAERALADKTALAKMQQQDRMRQDREAYTQSTVKTRQEREGIAGVQAVMATVPGDPQSAQHRFLANELAGIAAAHLTKFPQATRGEIAALPDVTTLVTEFQSLVPKVAAAKVATPKDALGRFRQQTATAHAAKRLAPGQSRIPALRAEKFKRGTTLDDLP